MPTGTIRKFAAPVLAPERAAEQLRRRDRVCWMQVIAGFVFGVPLLFLGPMAVALLIWLRLRHHGSYWALVLDCSPIVIPALLLLQIASGEKYLENMAVRDAESAIRVRSGGAILFLLFSMLGPGIVMAAYRRWQRLSKHLGANRARAGQVLADL